MIRISIGTLSVLPRTSCFHVNTAKRYLQKQIQEFGVEVCLSAELEIAKLLVRCPYWALRRCFLGKNT